MQDECYGRRYSVPGTLRPGLVDIRHLRLLLMLDSISNPRMVMALEDVLVSGLPRREACARPYRLDGSDSERTVPALSEGVLKLFKTKATTVAFALRYRD